MLFMTEGVGYKKEEAPKSLENKGGNLRKGGVSLLLASPASETSAATVPQAVPLAQVHLVNSAEGRRSGLLTGWAVGGLPG